MNELGIEVEEGRDDDVRLHRAHGRRPRREVPRATGEAEAGERVGRLWDEVHHAVQRLEGSPGLSCPQCAPAAHSAMSPLSCAANAPVAATIGRLLDASRTTSSRPSRSVSAAPASRQTNNPAR